MPLEGSTSSVPTREHRYNRRSHLGWTTIILASVLGVGLSQDRPFISLDIRVTDGSPTAYVSLRDLLADRRFLPALQSGFPLYVVYTLELRLSRSGWFDRTVDDRSWEFVVLYDPVRESYTMEESAGSSELIDDAALQLALARVFEVQLAPEASGQHYYKATIDARTLSDEDVNEVFDWLRGDDSDTLASHQRGILTRTARRLLVSVAPLPQISLVAQSQKFAWP